MKKGLHIFTLIAAAFVIAAISSALSFWACSRMQRPQESVGHEWIHTQLELSAEQEKALEPIEQRYHERRHALEEQIHEANLELAKAILEDGHDSQRVRDAISKIHSTMGELQEAAVGHVFEMEKVLTPDQYKKLLHLTADALGNIDSPHAGK